MIEQQGRNQDIVLAKQKLQCPDLSKLKTPLLSKMWGEPDAGTVSYMRSLDKLRRQFIFFTSNLPYSEVNIHLHPGIHLAFKSD